MKPSQVNIKNRRATFDYEISDTYTAGIVLTGTEIKSIRDGKAGLADTYVVIDNGEAWVKGMYVAESRRDRKLLLTRKELRKLARVAEDPGYTIIPLRLFISEKGLAKLVIGVARGKKAYDKRQSIREREDKRSLDRLFKS